MTDLDPFEEGDGPDGGATTIVRPKRAPEPKKTDPKRREVPRYHVILWDSEEHTYEYVERMLRELFGHDATQCLKIAETVDAAGRAVVLTTTKEHAELKRDQIQAYGKDESTKGCKGSMSATIEAVP
ncbi:ATP-dependent Clp protease adaptor [Pseudobythopirellula maris]|uniref:ATP-dependent Clp protease adaptor n=1 Tax=Pseudobythopirellula maris TaxID=2527991 RepID=A0A5C5ZU48_9BACT|nr:ATP-dependent Clp protease adaptor ClpS [Pseudobythopirellula maris]TWT90790.1 ATP-dependent Clp protease adaptor [Pseudobythopirellula maris]